MIEASRKQEAALAFRRADEVFSVELERVYGAKASEARYWLSSRHRDKGVLAAYHRRDEARVEWEEFAFGDRVPAA